MHSHKTYSTGESLENEIYQLENALKKINQEIKITKDSWLKYLYTSNLIVIEEILIEKRKELRKMNL
jgi:hypothetical protein